MSSDADSITKKDFEKSATPSEDGVHVSANPAALASARRKFDLLVLPIVSLFCTLTSCLSETGHLI